MTLQEYTKNNLLILDGAMGTLLQKKGLRPGSPPETFNRSNPEAVRAVHLSYLQAGAKMVLSNSFGVTTREQRCNQLSDTVQYAVDLAKSAAVSYNAYAALDIGPLGELLAPMGSLSFEEAYELFAQAVRAGDRAGADAIYIETMTDLREAKCAVLAAKENCSLPVFCTLSFEKNGRTFTGVEISAMALTLEGLGVDYIGMNCSLGPSEMRNGADELLKWTHLPVIIKPNAGLPRVAKGQTVYEVDADAFVAAMIPMLDAGVTVVGGCCGTTPEHIKRLAEAAGQRKPISRAPRETSAICSATQTIVLDCVRVIGERVNPTGKKKLQKALVEKNWDYVVAQGIEQADAGADILDVNVGMPKIDESAVMASVVQAMQTVVSRPLQIDSVNYKTLEAGLRAYNGKAIVNSVNGDAEILQKILPVVKKYGAAVVGLTLNHEGIPQKARQRFQMAEKIVEEALSYGIPKRDIFIDCLALASGAEPEGAWETLEAIRLVKERLGVKTVLGVSNVSFGLPARGLLNRTFLALALANGLDMPIMNPNDGDMMDTVYAFRKLINSDVGSQAYISRFQETPQTPAPEAGEKSILHYVENGLKDEIKSVVEKQLAIRKPMEIVSEILIPALDSIGKKYETGALFLPQLLQASETAKAAFEVVKAKMPPSEEKEGKKIILATVKGDIHDIGKNIVKVVLENYGYTVMDLGKDVAVDEIVTQALTNNVKLVGLSALMTTTLDNMEKTVCALKEADATIKTMVGGAVLTPEYAQKIGADYYARDAMAAVTIAKKVF